MDVAARSCKAQQLSFLALSFAFADISKRTLLITGLKIPAKSSPSKDCSRH